jgi:hypothetical protein
VPEAHRTLGWTLLAILGLVVVCCGVGGVVGAVFGYKALREASEWQPRQNRMGEVGIAYTNYCKHKGKAPESLNELRSTFRSPRDARTVEDGTVIVIYGVAPEDMPQGPAVTIVAYEKVVPTDGGYVAFGDGKVQWLTADRFAAAPKAAPRKKD